MSKIPLTGKTALTTYLKVMWDRDREITVSVNQNTYYRGSFTGTDLHLRKMQKIADGQWEVSQKWLDNHKNGFYFLYNQANRGKGIGVFHKANYLSQNGLGNDAFIDSTDLFYEIDDRSLEMQAAELQQFRDRTGLHPTAVVFSGGKSIQPHWRIKEPMTREQWTYAMSLLCAMQQSDSANVTLHRQIRLPGFNRKLKSGKVSHQSLLEANEVAYSYTEFVDRLKSAWQYPHAFTEQRWARYKTAQAVLRDTSKPLEVQLSRIAPLTDPIDAFKLPDEILFPRTETRTTDRGRTQSPASENPWVSFYQNEVLPVLERLPLEQQFDEFPHNFKRVGGKLVGDSPWSTNHSHTAFHVDAKSGEWYCHGSLRGSKSLTQYFQYCWYDRTGRGVRGRDYIDFVKRAAEKAGVQIPSDVLDAKILPMPKPDEAQADFDRWRKLKRFTSDVQINSRYFDWNPPENWSTLIIKSGLGTGKTHFLSELYARLKDKILLSEYENRDQGFVSISPKSLLTHNMCQRLKATIIKDCGNDLSKSDLRVSLCIDSIILFKPSDFDNKDLILDEIDAILDALERNTAIAKYRSQATYLLKQAIRRARRVICLSGTLTDSHCQWVITARGDKPVTRIENTYRGSGWQIQHYTNESAVLEKIHALSTDPNRIIAVMADSRVELERLDARLSLAGATLRIDSKTALEDFVKEFRQDPDQYIEKHKIRYLLFSPSIEGGIDISISNYFTDVFCLFYGQLNVSAMLQMMGRIRDPNPVRHLYCVPTGNLSQSLPLTAIDELEKYLYADGNAAIEGDREESWLKERVATLSNLKNDPYFSAKVDLGWVDKFEREHLRVCLIESLTEAGHTLSEPISDKINGLIKEVKAERQEIKRGDSVEIFNANDISDDQAAEISSSTSRTWQQQAQIAKHSIKSKLPGIESSPIWGNEFVFAVQYQDRDLISNAERFLLLQNPAFAKLLSQAKWAGFSRSDSIDLARVKSRYLEIKTLRDLGFMEFMNPDAEWTENSPAVQRIYKAGKNPEIARKIGKEVGKQKPIEFVSRLIKSFGLATESTQKRVNGSLVRFYSLRKAPPKPKKDDPKPDLYSLSSEIRNAVVVAVQRRFQHSLDAWNFNLVFTPEDQAQSLTGEGVKAVTPSLILYINTWGRCDSKEQKDTAPRTSAPSQPEEEADVKTPTQKLELPPQDDSALSDMEEWEDIVLPQTHPHPAAARPLAVVPKTPSPVLPQVQPTAEQINVPIYQRKGSLGVWQIVELLPDDRARVKQVNSWGFGECQRSDLTPITAAMPA